MKKKLILYPLLASCLLMGLLGCEKKSPNVSSKASSSSSSSTVENGITLPSYHVSLNPGASYQLVPELHGLTGTPTYASKNEAVASVDETGLVKALALGKAVIKVAVGDWSVLCEVTVVSKSNGGASALSLTLNETSLTLYQGTEFTLLPETSKDGKAVEATYTFVSSDATIVDATSSTLKALKEGSAEITVHAVDEEEETAFAMCSVRVLPSKNLLVEGYAERQVVVGTPLVLSYKLQNPLQIKDIPSSSLTYTSSDTSIAKPRAGKLNGVQKGTMSLTAVALVDGVSYTCVTSFRIRESYTVTFVVDGTTVHSESVLDGDAPTYQEVPTSSGKVFKNWKVGTGDFGGTVESNLTLTASFYSYSSDSTGTPYDIYSYTSKDNITATGGSYTALQKSDSFAWSVIDYFTTSIDGSFGIAFPAINYSLYPVVCFRTEIDFNFSTLHLGSIAGAALSKAHWSANEAHLIKIQSGSLYCDGTLISTVSDAVNQGQEGLLLYATNDTGSGRFYFSNFFTYLVEE